MKDFEQDLIVAKAAVLKALAHPVRLAMVETLGRSERCVCELASLVGANISTVSNHLSVLKQAGIVTGEKRGLQVFYSLRAPCLLEFLGCIEGVVLGGVQDLLGQVLDAVNGTVGGAVAKDEECGCGLDA